MFDLFLRSIASRLPPFAKAGIKNLAFMPGKSPRIVRGGALKGYRLYLDLRVDTQAWRGVYEQDLQDWMEHEIRSGAVRLDIGAAEGIWSLLMAIRAGRTGQVIAFEPSERGQDIERNLGLNSGVPVAPVEVVRAYVGNADGGSIDGVPLVSVDRLLHNRKIEKVDIVKIDVDGAELEVIKGMQETLQRDHPLMAIEVHSRELCAAVVEHLTKLNYNVESVDAPAYEHRPIGFNPTLYCKHH